MEITNYFKLICELKPLTDEHGQIVEYFPANEYKNSANKKLNQYGKGPFCQFRIPSTVNREGVYIIKANDDIKYIGECENLSQRFNLGYGLISPRNCFVGGQSTNCKINSHILKVTKNGGKVYLFFYETTQRFRIESELIKKYKPDWNSTSSRNNNSVNKRHVSKNSKGVKYMGMTYKYYPLERYLSIQNNNRIELTFSDIEKIIGDTLPPFAHKYLAWWACLC